MAPDNLDIPRFCGNVFINCPFDADYRPLLRALIFTLVDCGLSPRIATERADSGESRVDKIKELIRQSGLSVHDISRMEPLKPGDLPRFNMPFELGLDLGCREFGPEPLPAKRCLILETEPYRYQKVLSDISGNDIKHHRSDPETLVRCVRAWVVETVGLGRYNGTVIWRRFGECVGILAAAMAEAGGTGQDVEEMPAPEFIRFVREWKLANP